MKLRFGLFPFRSPLLRESLLISLPAATKMFQFTAFPSVWLWIHHTVTGFFPAGFPHSDTHGSIVVCTSPWLFAAFCVLHRLLVPRHSPFALLRLTLCKAIQNKNGLAAFLYCSLSRTALLACIRFSRCDLTLIDEALLGEDCVFHGGKEI